MEGKGADMNLTHELTLVGQLHNVSASRSIVL
jgi:hypothetical protein